MSNRQNIKSKHPWIEAPIDQLNKKVDQKTNMNAQHQIQGKVMNPQETNQEQLTTQHGDHTGHHQKEVTPQARRDQEKIEAKVQEGVRNNYMRGA